MDNDSESLVIEMQWGSAMKKRNNPVRISNHVVVVHTPYSKRAREYRIPDHVKETYNRVVVANGKICVNGYELNEDTGEFKKTIRSRLIDLLLF